MTGTFSKRMVDPRALSLGGRGDSVLSKSTVLGRVPEPIPSGIGRRWMDGGGLYFSLLNSSGVRVQRTYARRGTEA